MIGEVVCVAAFALMSFVITVWSASLLPASEPLEETLQRAERILIRRPREGIVHLWARAAIQSLFCYFHFKMRTWVGRLDLALVAVLASTIFVDWQKVILKGMELFERLWEQYGAAHLP